MRVDPHRQPHAKSSTPPEPHSDHLSRVHNEERDEEQAEKRGGLDLSGAHDIPDEEEPAADRDDDGRFEPL